MDVRQEPKLALRRKQRGFTMVEIVIAVLVLSLSIVTMVGLQSSAVQRTLNDQRHQQATLAARAILAALEVRGRSGRPIEDINLDDTLSGLISQVEPLDGINDWQKRPELDAFTASLVIEPWEVPIDKVPKDAIKRVTLEIRWGEGANEKMNIFYFVAGQSNVPD